MKGMLDAFTVKDRVIEYSFSVCKMFQFVPSFSVYQKGILLFELYHDCLFNRFTKE